MLELDEILLKIEIDDYKMQRDQSDSIENDHEMFSDYLWPSLSRESQQSGRDHS